jgi:arsenate reductase (thioredoxin)
VSVHNVLFLCTGNSARSILAEALLNQLGVGRFRAFSAGSHPKGVVNPWTLTILREAGLPAAGLRSKSWDEFAAPDTPRMDLVVTVCDDAAGEICPIWPGQPITAHWGIPDPAATAGDDQAMRRAFGAALAAMRRRVQHLVALPTGADRAALAARAREIATFDRTAPAA